MENTCVLSIGFAVDGTVLHNETTVNARYAKHLNLDRHPPYFPLYI